MIFLHNLCSITLFIVSPLGSDSNFNISHISNVSPSSKLFPFTIHLHLLYLLLCGKDVHGHPFILENIAVLFLITAIVQLYMFYSYHSCALLFIIFQKIILTFLFIFYSHFQPNCSVIHAVGPFFH